MRPFKGAGHKLFHQLVPDHPVLQRWALLWCLLFLADRNDDSLPRRRPLPRSIQSLAVPPPSEGLIRCDDSWGLLPSDRSTSCNTLDGDRVEQNKLAPLRSPETWTSSSGSFVVPLEKMCCFLPQTFFPPQRPPDSKLEHILTLSRPSLFRFFEACVRRSSRSITSHSQLRLCFT